MNPSETVEQLRAYVDDIPPVDRLGVYAKGGLRVLQRSLQIQLDRFKNEAAIKAQGPDFFNGVESRVFSEMSEQIMNDMNWTLETHGEVPQQRDPTDRWVYIMNHPTLIGMWTPLDFLGQHFAAHTVAVARSSLLKNKFTALMLGNPLRDMGRALFIDRDNREEALAAVREQAAAVLRPNTGLLIFPDGRRPYPSRLLKEKRTWSKKVPEAKTENWMTETCFPRSGGLFSLLQATEEVPNLRFAQFTVAEPLERGGIFHVALEELRRADLVGAEPSEDHLKNWLLEEWKRKNEQIRGWRGL